jgi:hypothetical protein
LLAGSRLQHRLTIDKALTPSQHNTDLLIRRMLDDLSWVMSYSRWKDDRFWPLFRDAILRIHPDVTAESLEAAREYNFERYHFQGIGRYEPAAAYARGVADLRVLANLFPGSGFYSVQNRAALMPGSMDSPPIFTSMRSTRHCESFSFPSRTLSYTADWYTPLCRDEPPGDTAVSRYPCTGD